MTFLRNLLVLALPLSILGAANFEVTPTLYPAEADHDKVCKIFFGDTAVVADYATDIKPMNAVKLEALLDELEIPESTNRYYYFVKNDGKQLFSGRHAYFFENHGGPPPSYFPTVESKDDIITLGATDKYGYIMCKINEPKRD